MAEPRARPRAAAWIALPAAFSAACGAAAITASHEARFQAGNDAYERGAYEEAAAVYQELAGSGVVSAALQHNLGNALFKSGRLGPAILAYERALRLEPKDPDVRSNLDYLRTLTADRIDPAPSPLAALGIAYLLDLTSPDEDAAILLASWLLAGAACGVALAAGSARLRKAALYGAAALAFPVLASGTALAAKTYMAATRVDAVVLAPEVNVLSGAAEGSPTLFTIHEGLRLRLHGRSGDWVQVSLENGLAGWIPASAVEAV